MTTVAIVYHSASGRTRSLAEAVARGATSIAGTEAQLIAVADVDHATLLAADAIVFGCPTYMGSASAAFKAFMDGTSAIWALQAWHDKLAAAFTHSAAPSGDKLGTLTQLAVFAAQHGMIWVGLGLPPTYAGLDPTATDTNRLGSHLGAMAQSPPGARSVPDSDLRTAEHLGRRIAEAAARWARAAPAVVSTRHATTTTWTFPASDRAPLPAPLERSNLKELVARPDRFEHHLVVCATIDGVQLEIVTASEPLYFGHVNWSDEYAIPLLTGDDLIDRFPLRTFLSDATSGVDVGRYNHRIGDLVLHPVGYAHWPGRLRAPYEPYDIPPGIRRCGISLVYCASAPTPATPTPVAAPLDRADDIKAYVSPGPPMAIVPVRGGVPGTVAAIGSTSLLLVERPPTIAPVHGGWVVVLEADPASPHASCDLIRIPAGTALDANGIVRAFVFASSSATPDPVPPAWRALPPAPFAAFEDLPRGVLPFAHGELAITEVSARDVLVSVRGESAQVPRYWFARMAFRVALHQLRLGYVETYGGLFIDDHGSGHGAIHCGLRTETSRVAIEIPRADALEFVERCYRAVAPDNYRERLR